MELYVHEKFIAEIETDTFDSHNNKVSPEYLFK